MAKPTQNLASVIKKDLKYCVAVSLIDFNPEKQGPRTILFEGKLAIRLKGHVYTKA